MKITICIGSSCHLKGSYNVIQTFQQKLEEEKLHDKVEMKATFCCKQCHADGISVVVNDKVFGVKPDKADEFFDTEVAPPAK